MMLPQMATWTECGLIWASTLLHSAGGPWPHSSLSVLRMAHKGPVGCVSLCPSCRTTRKGETHFIPVTVHATHGAQRSSQTPSALHRCLWCMCVSLAPLVCHTTIPAFPQSWCGDTQFSIREDPYFAHAVLVSVNSVQFWHYILGDRIKFQGKDSVPGDCSPFQMPVANPDFTCICD